MPQTAKRPRLLRPRAGTAATALFLSALALSATTAWMIAPASAQSAASAIDQPTPATVAGPRAADGVVPPRALAPATDVMSTGSAKGAGSVDPARHLPGDMRRGG